MRNIQEVFHYTKDGTEKPLILNVSGRLKREVVGKYFITTCVPTESWWNGD